MRIGGRPNDQFITGTFQSDGLRIGFIRIPRFSPLAGTDENAELARLVGEIVFLQQNTDGLVVDVMHNPGGRIEIVEGLASVLMPRTFRTVGYEVRATWAMVRRFESNLEAARAAGAPAYEIDVLERFARSVRTAYEENCGRTGALSLTQPSLDIPPFATPDGITIAYTKPLMVLIDDVSFSGADMFPAVIKDNGRGILFGYRTAGAGGSVSTLTAGAYTEGSARVTQTLMVRPDGRYIENAGVEPDIENDYMTRENLMTGGRPFVQAFTRAIVQHIRNSQ